MVRPAGRSLPPLSRRARRRPRRWLCSDGPDSGARRRSAIARDARSGRSVESGRGPTARRPRRARAGARGRPNPPTELAAPECGAALVLNGSHSPTRRGAPARAADSEPRPGIILLGRRFVNLNRYKLGPRIFGDEPARARSAIERPAGAGRRSGRMATKESALTGLEPRSFWEHFEALTTNRAAVTPRGAGDRARPRLGRRPRVRARAGRRPEPRHPRPGERRARDRADPDPPGPPRHGLRARSLEPERSRRGADRAASATATG